MRKRRQDSRSKRQGDLARGQLVCFTVIAQEQCDIGLNRGKPAERGREEGGGQDGTQTGR